VAQLARVQLTDIRGGRLHLDDRVILLAEPVRDRVDAYLAYRTATWPASINAYLFIHARSWKTTRPVRCGRCCVTKNRPWPAPDSVESLRPDGLAQCNGRSAHCLQQRCPPDGGQI
jgi:hypothetical protein